MRVDGCDCRQPAVIRNAENADLPVVPGNVLDQPIDRVIRVRALVNRLRFLPVAHRAVHQKLSFGTEASANVLEYEDVSIFNQIVVAAIDAVRV